MVARGIEVARLVLLAGPETAASLDQRVVAVALADQLGAAMAVADAGRDRCAPARPGRVKPDRYPSVMRTAARQVASCPRGRCSRCSAC